MKDLMPLRTDAIPFLTTDRVALFVSRLRGAEEKEEEREFFFSFIIIVDTGS